MNVTSIFVAAALTGLLFSCKQKPSESYCDKNPSECQTVALAKEFFHFKEGSWWVYEEETSHERDSIYVVEQSNGSGYNFYMRMKSALTDFEFQYWPMYYSGNPLCSINQPVQGKCLYITVTKDKPGVFSGSGKCFFVNFKEGVYEAAPTDSFPDNAIEVQSIFETYTLGSLSFNQTVKIKEPHTVIENNQLTYHYYARNVGMIRKELADSSQVWNLVSYHIEP